MQLVVHHMFLSSNCHVHAQVVRSHGGRLLVSQHDLSGMIPVQASVLAGARGVQSAKGILDCCFPNES